MASQAGMGSARGGAIWGDQGRDLLLSASPAMGLQAFTTMSDSFSLMGFGDQIQVPTLAQY